MKQRAMYAQESIGESRVGWAGRFGYGLAVAAAATLASFLVVLFTGPSFSNRETWEGFAIAWVIAGVPAAIVAAALSAAVIYGFYVRRTSWCGIALVFIPNVLAVTGVALFGAAMMVKL